MIRLIILLLVTTITSVQAYTYIDNSNDSYLPSTVNTINITRSDTYGNNNFTTLYGNKRDGYKGSYFDFNKGKRVDVEVDRSGDMRVYEW